MAAGGSEHSATPFQEATEQMSNMCLTDRNVEILHEFGVAESQMKKIKDGIENEKDFLHAQKNKTITQIQRKIKEVEVLGQKKIAEVESKFKQECEGLDREAHVIEQSTLLVQKSINDFNRATNVGSEEDIVLATRQAEDDASKYHDFVKKSSHLTHTTMNFVPDDALNYITTLGNVGVEKSTIRVDLTPEVIRVFHTKLTAKGTIWLDVLPSGQMIVLGRTPKHNMQLSLYSANKKLISQLDLPRLETPDAMLDDNRVIVPMMVEKQLQIVNTDNGNLTKGHVINTGAMPLLIVKYLAGSVLVLTVERFVKSCFQIIDLTGKVEKQITLNTDLPDPQSMRMSPNKDAVYIVDFEKGCLGFNLQGDEIFHCRNRHYNIYSGLAVDPHGALYFCPGESPILQNMIKVSSAGQFIKEIHIRGLYPVQCVGNKLYVTFGNDKNEETLGYFYV